MKAENGKKKCPNLQDLFSFEDIVLAEKIRRTLKPGLSRIALCAPDQRCDVNTALFPHSGTVRRECLTLKLKYAMLVWTRAIILSKDSARNMQYYWWLHWEENETSFKSLEYSDFHSNITVDELLKGFWALLESIADSGQIKVSEDLSWVIDVRGDASPRLKCVIVADQASGEEVYQKTLYDYPYNETPRSYKWDEIKDMFVELTLDQLRLVQGAEMHKCNAIDRILFDACIRGDMDGVRYAVDKGADVNALGHSGNSPLAQAIEDGSYKFYDLSKEKEYTKADKQRIVTQGRETAMEIARFLVDHGADVDLFGYDGMQPVLAAYYDSNVDMVRFLLEKGSNPNYDSYMADYWDDPLRQRVSSAVLQCICEDPDPLTPEVAAIEELIYRYGGRLERQTP